MTKYVLGVDQGTTSSRAILFDLSGKPVYVAQREFTQIVPHPGWCEHDPNEIFASVESVISEVLLLHDYTLSSEPVCHTSNETARLHDDVICIGIANQRETLVVWDKVTGEPLHNAIVWLDTRTSDFVDLYKPLCDQYRSTTGLPVSTYFSALKIRWLMDHVPAVQHALSAGRCCFGTVDSWLVFKMTEGRVHVTDVTNASRYNLFDLSTLTWSTQICNTYKIPLESLPRVVSSSEVVGHYKNVPISALLGDQQAALLGQGCLLKGQAKITYGTGAFLLVNAGEQLDTSASALLTTVGYQLGANAPVSFALEAAIASAGRAVDWLKQVGLISSNEELETLAGSVPSSAGVSLVPAFSGLFCPQWRPDARACLVGLSLATKKPHICRAVLEGVALQVEAVIREIPDLQLQAPLQADGGMTNNALFLQIQANVLNHPVAVRDFREATVWGAALAAGLAVGVFDRSKIDEYRANQGGARVIHPEISEDDRRLLVDKFTDAVSRSFNLSHFEH